MSGRCVIFALARTGSTTLMRALNCHPSLRIVNEPFNEHNFGGEILARVSGLGALKHEIELLWGAYNGIKHVWHPSGWPFGPNTGLNEYLATSAAESVVLLERTNVLRRVVSSQMSQQSGLWETYTEEARNRHLSHRFLPLDRQWIRDHIADERETLSRLRTLVASSGIRFFIVTYETLYEQGRQTASRTLEQLLQFLVEPNCTANGSFLKILGTLSDLSDKLNSPQSYSAVPNIQDIEQEFGSDRTGWLFQ